MVSVSITSKGKGMNTNMSIHQVVKVHVIVESIEDAEGVINFTKYKFVDDKGNTHTVTAFLKEEPEA